MHMELNGPTKDGEQLKTMLLEAEVAISKPLSPFPTPCGHIYRERERERLSSITIEHKSTE